MISGQIENADVVNGNLNRSIEAVRDLVVQGDLLHGHKIFCRSSLTVYGTIRGSEIVCYGDLIAENGIDCDKLNQIVVKGKVKARYINSANIECDKNLTVGADIINSKIRCRQSIVVDGVIVGGEVSAAGTVTAVSIGRMGQEQDFTKVEAGTNFRLKVMQEEMDKEVAEISAKADKIRAAVNALEQKEKTHYTGLSFTEKKLYKSTRESFDIFEKQVLGLKARQQKLLKKLEQAEQAYIEVKEKIVKGSRITIQHRFVVAAKDYPAGKFTIKDDRICRI